MRWVKLPSTGFNGSDLQSDFTNLSNSSRIRKIAKEKLGLQRTNSYQIKKLSDFYIN